MPDSPINEEALTTAHKAIEDVLIEFRDRRISVAILALGIWILWAVVAGGGP